MCRKRIVCRVCLEPQQNDHVSLSEKYRDFVLYEFINTITSLNIRLSDGFTDKICTACHSELISSIDFKEKCEASDAILRLTAVKQELLEECKSCSVKSEDADETIKIEKDYLICDDNIDSHLDLELEKDVKEENEELGVCVVQTPADRPSRAIDLKLICDDCGGSFKSKCKLKVHWKKMHMCESLVCPLCKRAFKSYKAFHQHKKKKTQACAIAADDNVTVQGVGKSRIFGCKHCNYKSKRIIDIKAHVVIHTGDRPYNCDMCSKSYTQLKSLQGHREMTHQLYICQITCHICGKTVKGRWRIDQHIKLHTKVECPVCHKNLSKASYSQHMKRHSGNKSYKCDKCTYTFYTISELNHHENLKHSNNINRCEQCDFTCINKHRMKIHRNKHNPNNIPCTVCGRFFFTREKLVHHQRLHFAEKSHSCPQCNTKFFKKDSMLWHLKKKHSETTKELKITPPIVKIG